MGIKGLYDAKLVSIYILGKPAEGDLARPFKAPSMFGGMLFFRSPTLSAVTLTPPYPVQSGPQTDAASIAEAEKRVGKKDE